MDKSHLAVATYEKLANFYTEKYFDDLADNIYIDLFLEKLSSKARVLDAGCGPGQFSNYMHQKGFAVVGIDLSQEMLAIARSRVVNVNFLNQDIRHLDFPENYFNGILAAYSLIHIPSEDIPHTLQGFHRVLKPAGYIEIIAQAGEPDQTIAEPFLPTEKMFFNFFTTQRLSNYLQQSGFTIEYQLETISQDPDSVSNTIIYTLAKKI